MQAINKYLTIIIFILIKKSLSINPPIPLNETKIVIKYDGEIPYTAHGAQITPPLLFLILFIFCFYAYFRLGLAHRVRKEDS